MLKDIATQGLINEYTKRISAKIIFVDQAIKVKSSDSEAVVKKKQAEGILASLNRLNKSTFIIALDEKGKNYDSISFAQNIEKAAVTGFSHLCFIIGGAYGLQKDILMNADLTLSFGKMVWPHRLVSVMLLEQLYRAQQIIAGHPYHKA